MTASDWGPDSHATIGRDVADSVPSVAAPARTPVLADTEEQDDREALSGDHSGSSTWAAIQALAALLEPEAFDPDVKAVPEWREPTMAVAVNHAAKVITSGYRLVSDDEATVDRVARALAETAADVMPWEELAQDYRDDYALLARAAVWALREAGQ